MTATKVALWKMVVLLLTVGGVSLDTGCALKEVRSKWKVGPEFRDKHDGTEENRWTAQTGLEMSFDNGWKTGMTYRRRDVDRGSGDHDDGLWLEWSFPLWKAKSKSAPAPTDVAALERRVAELESRLHESSEQ